MSLPQLPSNLVSTPPSIPDYTADVQNIASQALNAEQKIKETILKNTLPDSLFTATMPGVNQPDFEQIERQVDEKISLFMKSVNIPTLPALPRIPLLPKIPTITVPSPAELLLRAQQLIDQRKKKLQEQQLKAQLADAEREDSPFSARRAIEEQKNKVVRKRFGPQG